MASVTTRRDGQVSEHDQADRVIQQAEEVRAKAGVVVEDPWVIAPVPGGLALHLGARLDHVPAGRRRGQLPGYDHLPVSHRGDLTGDHHLSGGDQHVVSLSRGVGQQRAGEPHLTAEHLDVLHVGGRVVADAAGAAGQGRPESRLAAPRGDHRPDHVHPRRHRTGDRAGNDQHPGDDQHVVVGADAVAGLKCWAE